MRLTVFLGLEVLNIILHQEPVLLGFTAACSHSPTMGADMPISIQQCQTQISPQPLSSSPGALIPKQALSKQK